MTPILALALLGFTACGPAEAPVAEDTGRQEDRFLLGGIQVNEPDHERWMSALDQAGFNTVSVTVYAHQGDWDTDHLWFATEESAVVHEIRAARKAGIRVVLILRVALDHAFEANRFLWHGMIMPRTDEQLASWFRQYSDFVLGWARIAEQEGVEVLGVASEMNALTSTIPIEKLPDLEEFYLDPLKQLEYREEVLRHGEQIDREHLKPPGSDGFADLGDLLDAEIATKGRWAAQVTQAEAASPEERIAAINRRRALLDEHWRELIRQVREVYRGRLTYAANFDQYHLVGFWQHLDLMGINAYFQLRQRFEDDESAVRLLARLTEGWRGVLEDVLEVRRRQGLGEMPVLFTELGYTARRHSTVQPWSGSGFSIVYAPVEVPAGEAPVWERRFIVWQDQPWQPQERALAIRALRLACQQVDPRLLTGLLYWKLSTVASHEDIEPFVLLLEKAPADPMLGELRALRRSFPPSEASQPSGDLDE